MACPLEHAQLTILAHQRQPPLLTMLHDKLLDLFEENPELSEPGLRALLDSF